jgi:hypothetical protein
MRHFIAELLQARDGGRLVRAAAGGASLGNMREDSTVWEDAALRRPALDPTIPRAARDLLRTRTDRLTSASREHPGTRLNLLPAHPQRRETTVYDAVTGMTTALFVAVAGASPWAFGVLIFQQPTGWQSASGRYGLLLAEIIVAVTAIIFGTRVARFGGLGIGDPAAAAARTYHGRYCTGADLDARARVLLRRVQDAVHTVRSAEICRAGLLDEPATSAALDAQEWDIALALREQARLRSERSALAAPSPRSPAAELLEDHRQAARAAEQSITRRVSAVERYAAEVRQADAAYRDWRQHTTIAELTGRHLDMLARTAADEHGINELNAMTKQARAVRRVLSEDVD